MQGVKIIGKWVCDDDDDDEDDDDSYTGGRFWWSSFVNGLCSIQYRYIQY